MKVCTDACLFGAWIARNTQWNEKQRALDIGGGTGLLSLLLAQQHSLSIDVVEINEQAAEQATQNIEASPWKNQIQVIHSALQDFHAAGKYDFIFSNPPFFENDLKSTHHEKNDAKHDQSLSFKELIQFIAVHISENGVGALLIPYHRLDYLRQLLQENQLYCNQEMMVRQSTRHDYFRAMIIFSKNKSNTISQEMSIHNAERKYTEEFSALLKDYYLN